ncbi:MAG TPA: RHS repeat-associated core domain-containing protein [Candidatus Binataceae bacterium]|nr:RHS repeat-associated core domain-containing protein [Candidatus Binataceae bacterium]
MISSGTYAMLGEVFGSVAGLVNSSGALATQYGYGAYGATTTSGASSTNPFQYLGRELDPSGLYGLRARYYSPIMGRFISLDPIGFASGQANLMVYSFDGPTNFLDPLGLQGCGSGGGIQCNECNNWLGACYAGGGACKVGHASGHKAPPIHLKFPVPTSPAPSPGQPTLPAAGADSISRKSWARSWPKRAQSSSRQCSADRG